MAIETICSGCGKTLAVPDEHAGKKARCPACGQIYTIPHASNEGDSPFTENRSADSAEPSQPSYTASQSDSGSQSDAGADEQFWMRTASGQEYGPTDRATLDRWFQEGRVGADYQIRQGSGGIWQSAPSFQPARHAPASGNPYADSPYQPPAPGQGMYTYPKADQSGLVLAMGILGFLVCPLFGLIAWVLGHGALKDIQAGRADPANKTLVQVGYYLGMANVILATVCIGGYIVIIALALVGQNF